MSIYDSAGSQIYSAYNKNGVGLQVAYGADGSEVFSGEPTPKTSLKVMTYNVGGWYIGSGSNVPAAEKDVYYALQTGMIRGNDPDVLFINEYQANFSADGTSALTMLQSLFPYVVAKTGGPYHGRAICSKFPISNYTQHNFSSGNQSCYYDTAKITVDGKKISLVVTHLTPNPASDQHLQIQELADYLKTLNSFIAAGDYNTGISPTNNTDNVGSTQYQYSIKTFTDNGFHTANCGDFGFLVTCNDGVDGSGANWDIDNIITSADIDILSASVDTTKLTDSISGKIDHMPLIAELAIN